MKHSHYRKKGYNTRQYQTIVDNRRQYKTILDNSLPYHTIPYYSELIKTLLCDPTVEKKPIFLFTVPDSTINFSVVSP
jgi:hypothetical protein